MLCLLSLDVARGHLSVLSVECGTDHASGLLNEQHNQPDHQTHRYNRQSKVTSAAMETPTVLISCSISARSSALDAAVRNGKKGTTSPCQICS